MFLTRLSYTTLLLTVETHVLIFIKISIYISKCEYEKIMNCKLFKKSIFHYHNQKCQVDCQHSRETKNFHERYQ